MKLLSLVFAVLQLLNGVQPAKRPEEPAKLTPKIAGDLAQEIAFEIFYARHNSKNQADDMTTEKGKKKELWERSTIAILEVNGDLYISGSIFTSLPKKAGYPFAEDFGLDEVDMLIAMKVIKHKQELAGYEGTVNFVKWHKVGKNNKRLTPTNKSENRGAHAEPQLINNLLKMAKPPKNDDEIEEGNPKPEQKLILGVSKPLCPQCSFEVPNSLEKTDMYLQVGFIKDDGNPGVSIVKRNLKTATFPPKKTYLRQGKFDTSVTKGGPVKGIGSYLSRFGDKDGAGKDIASKCPTCEKLYGFSQPIEHKALKFRQGRNKRKRSIAKRTYGNPGKGLTRKDCKQCIVDSGPIGGAALKGAHKKKWSTSMMRIMKKNQSRRAHKIKSLRKIMK